MKQIKICFISRQAYPYLSKNNFGSAGGSERKQVNIAKELVKRGHSVSFIVGDYGQPNYEEVDGIKIYKDFTYYKNNLLERILQPLKLFKLMRKINADFYYRRTPHIFIILFVIFSKLLNKKFIFASGSDRNFEIGEYKKMGRLFKLFYKFSIQNADIVLFDNYYQEKTAHKNFGIAGITLTTPIKVPKKSSIKTNKPIVVFIGNLIPIKRPELFIELSKNFKNYQFYLIGPSTDKTYQELLKKKAENIDNLKIVGFVNPERIFNYYKKDIILVNTSKVEGFTNTFLEAWSYGNPVVSLNVDPNEVICKYGIGFHSKTIENMNKHLKILLENKKLRKELGLKGKEYVINNHNITRIIYEFERILLDYL